MKLETYDLVELRLLPEDQVIVNEKRKKLEALLGSNYRVRITPSMIEKIHFTKVFVKSDKPNIYFKILLNPDSWNPELLADKIKECMKSYEEECGIQGFVTIWDSHLPKNHYLLEIKQKVGDYLTSVEREMIRL